MSYNKMNILHLHASDMCRWSIESKLYPELTQNLTGLQAGHYTQEDIKNLIEYAGYRGIRVVPEFDIPGHSGGLRPLIEKGLEFCTSDKYAFEIYNDAQNQTLDIMKKLFTEMSSLFVDEIINIGADEVSFVGKCNKESLASIEKEIIAHLISLGKTPMGWQELYLATGAARNDTTILASWKSKFYYEII